MAIEYKLYTTPGSKLEHKLVEQASQLKVEGNFLLGPLNLWDAKYYLLSVLADYKADPKYKYANPITVEQDDTSVYLLITGTETGKQRKLVGFEGTWK